MNVFAPLDGPVVSIEKNIVKIQRLPAIKCMSIVDIAGKALEDWSAAIENSDNEDILTVTLCFADQEAANSIKNKIQEFFRLKNK